MGYPQNFVSQNGPPISAAWLNALDVLANSPAALNGAQNVGQILVALGLTQAEILAFLLANGIFPPTQQSTGEVLFPETAAELAAGATPSNYAYQTGDVRRYGAVLDGATDCTAALGKACSVGGLIFVLGPMALASASLAALPNQAIALKSNTKICGVPGAAAVITGTAACNVFYSTDQSNIEFEDFFCIGNGSSSGTTPTGYFWYIKATAAATSEQTGHKFIRGGLSNFGGLYWIYADNTAAVSFAFSRFLCEGSVFLSQTGNAQTPSLVTVTASVFGFSGSDSVTTFYTMKDCVVRNCYADGTHLKNFVYFWSGAVHCKAYSNTLVGFGTGSEFSNDTGCYALATYDHSHGAGLPPDEIEFDSNTIDAVRDCGIYSASANPTTTFTNRVSACNNRISGQTSTANGVTPKGAIVFSSTYQAVAKGNILFGCAIGVSVVQNNAAGALAEISGTTCEAMPNNGYGVILSGASGGNAQKIVVDGFKTLAPVGTGTTGIYVNATATIGINNLDLLNIDVDACNTGILVSASDSSVPALVNVRLGNIKMRGVTATNIEFAGCTSTGQRVVVENVTLCSMQVGAVGLYMAGMPNVTVRNVVFEDLISGATYCWYGGGATGRLAGMQFCNVAVANRFDSSSNRLGVDAPGSAGNDNDFVQNLDVTELGTTSSKYVRMGWTWDRVNAAWKECRSLTGN